MTCSNTPHLASEDPTAVAVVTISATTGAWLFTRTLCTSCALTAWEVAQENGEIVAVSPIHVRVPLTLVAT
jgi:hypothetical protein